MTFFEYYRDRNNQDVLYLHGKNLQQSFPQKFGNFVLRRKQNGNYFGK